MEPTALTAIDFVNIPGLYYIDSIITHGNEIIDDLDDRNWIPLSSSKNSRKVQHYGFKYNYTTRRINEPADPMPECINELQDTLTNVCKQLHLIDTNYTFNQVIVNNYKGGSQGIGKHTDVKSYGAVIGCFTLGSGATMVFTNKKNESFEVYVRPNSLYIMSGPSRYEWTHEMEVAKYDTVDGVQIERERRVSVTFRNVPV